MNKLIEVEVSERIVIPFVWRDSTPGGSNLGRAEFVICTKYKYGKAHEFWVTPLQQRDAKYYWHYTGYIDELGITFSAYEGLDNPYVWMSGWCKEHKAVFNEVYVPNDSAYLEICSHGLHFWRTDIFKGKYRGADNAD